jgi:antitoxin component YwqK of YwqJK toxin-antitoxin module
LKRVGAELFYRETLFSGNLVGLNELGDTISIIPFLNGKEDGLAYVYGKNKKVLEIREFVKGWKQGRHKGWYENGKPKFMFNFKDDNFQGEYKEWTPTGILFREMHFKNGQEDGMQTIYTHDGKIKSNYMIIDGIRYGKLGNKTCVNKKSVDSGQ